MWLYRFIDPATRSNIPSLPDFLKWNHDITTICYDQTYLPQEERLTFLQRLFKFLFYLGVLLSFVYVMGDLGNDQYYTNMCKRRAHCLKNCAIDYYPHTQCQNLEKFSFEYHGNNYTHLFVYPKPSYNNSLDLAGYNQCAEYALDSEKVDKVPRKNRQARVHSCFPYCPSSGSIDPICSSVALLCVSSDEKCEFTTPIGEYLFDTSQTDNKKAASISPLVGLIAICITMPIQLLFELYCILVAKAKISDKDSAWITIRTVIMQFFVAAALIIILVYDAFCLIDVHTNGKPITLWLTYAFAFVLDQTKSVVFLCGIWYFLLRRCGYLQPVEGDYQGISIANKFSIPLITQLRNLCMQYIETPLFTMISRYMLGIYAGFVLFWLSVVDIIDMDDVCAIIDIVFLSIFAAELIVKIFGLGITYLFDFLNFMDAVIIAVSLGMYAAGIVSKVMAVLRLVRILLVIVVKFTGNQFNITIIRNKEEDPVQSLETLLQDLLKETCLKKSIKDEINWALDVISQNTLEYMDMKNTKLDLYEDTWLKIATGNDIDAKKWFDKDLEDALNEIHRESEEQAKLRIEGGIDHVRRYLDLNNKEWIVANKLSDDLRTSLFDENVFCEFMKDKALIFLGFKLWTYYDLFDKFGIGPDQMAGFLKQATSSYYKTNNPYHNLLFVIGILHNLHYFIIEGGLTKHLTDLQIMALLLAGISYCFSHPYFFIF